MKRKFMSRYLDEKAKKAAPEAAERQEPNPKDEQGDAAERAPEANPAALGMAQDIYDDTEVCRALGVRRRVLVRARTEKSRGRDWLAKGLHVGMTKKWVEAQRKGASEGLRPIEPNDGIVTAKFIRRVANSKLAGVRIVASGLERVAWVHDANAMNLGDEFDCRWIGRQLHYVDALNREAY